MGQWAIGIVLESEDDTKLVYRYGDSLHKGLEDGLPGRVIVLKATQDFILVKAPPFEARYQFLGLVRRAILKRKVEEGAWPTSAMFAG